MIRRLSIPLGLALIACLLGSALAYARYKDWPPGDDIHLVRAYLPEAYPVAGARHYTYRNYTDSWELYRFTTTSEAIARLTESLHLARAGTVHEFPLIISKPPPYWWDPKLLSEADLYHSAERAPDGQLYDLLYSTETGIAYLIRFDG